VATATRQRAAPRARSAGPLAPVAIRRRSGGSISILARMRAPGAVQPIITLKQGGRAGVRAQQTGVAGVVSGRGSRRWAYGAGGSEAVRSADAGELRGGTLRDRMEGRLGACGARRQEGSGVAVHAHTRSHRCRARWAERAPAVLLRWQCRGWRCAMRGCAIRCL
jgi:hypothetical protein